MPETAVAKRTKKWTKRDNNQRAEVLALLDANRGCLSLTSQQTGIPETTIQYWDQVLAQRDEALRSLRVAKREDLAETATDMAWEALYQARRQLPEASARDAAVVFGIAVDKAQVLRGLPTVIHGEAHPLLSKLTADQLRALAAGEVPAVVEPGAPLTLPSVDVTASGCETGVPVALPAGERVQADAERAGDAGCGVQGRGAMPGE